MTQPEYGKRETTVCTIPNHLEFERREVPAEKKTVPTKAFDSTVVLECTMISIPDSEFLSETLQLKLLSTIQCLPISWYAEALTIMLIK